MGWIVSLKLVPNGGDSPPATEQRSQKIFSVCGSREIGPPHPISRAAPLDIHRVHKKIFSVCGSRKSGPRKIFLVVAGGLGRPRRGSCSTPFRTRRNIFVGCNFRDPTRRNIFPGRRVAGGFHRRLEPLSGQTKRPPGLGWDGLSL